MKPEVVLKKLRYSKFRSSFHLRKYMYDYIEKKGMDEIKNHAEYFVKEKLAVYNPLKDGKQTPLKNHPVFIAMHACACCCRGCLEKWHHIPKTRELTKEERKDIVNLLILWIEEEYKRGIK